MWTEPGMNGTETVITSAVSKGFPIADAGFGAVAYVLDILTGAMGDQRRWRTMPWLVLVFGLLIVPLGAVSIGFIIIQPTVIGALCALCLVQAAITVILIPYSVDEVWATLQFLLQSRRAGRPFWRTLLRGGPGFSEERDRTQGLDMPFAQVAREFLAGGVTYPWTLLASVVLGAFLLTTPVTLAVEAPLYFSDQVVGCLVITIAVTALAEVTRAVRFLNVPLGLWIAASPLLLAGGGGLSGTIHVALGLGLAALSLPRGRRTKEHYGGWDRYIV
jgi:Vitamin K epoxide reductase family